MWSTGVIIYVSLSGQFPFNEDVDIEDQIKNAQFMYPPKPWSCVSQEAINCIKHCLVVRREYRYSVDQALNDPFFNNELTKQDLKDLEERIGQVWITNLRRPFTTFNSEDSIEQHEPHPAFIYKSSV